MRRVLSGVGVWLGAVVVASACTSKESAPGPVASIGAGGGGGQDPCPTTPEIDATPPPDPGEPEDPPSLDCGQPSFVDGTGLRRYPYLQSTTHDSARVAWTATGVSEGVVRYATSSGGPWTEVSATAETFPVSRTGDTEEYVAFDASLTGLEENRAYCYEVLIDGEVVASGLELHTAWSGTSRPVRILAFGDSGNASPEQAAVRDAFMDHEFDVFLHLGDMAYGDGTYPEFEERVFSTYRDFMHQVPSFPTIGNHEYKTNRAEPYLSVYYLFEQAYRQEDQERYYSFDYGNVHFVSLDSNDEMTLPILLDLEDVVADDMIDWLRDDLAASDAEWKIAFFHHPPFSMYDDRPDNTGVTAEIMPALAAGGVDLIMVGHDHHYVRSFPIRGDCQVPGGEGAIPFILVGSGGTGLKAFEDPDDWYVASGNDTIHAFLSFTVHGCRGHGQAIDIQGQVIDEFVINGCE